MTKIFIENHVFSTEKAKWHADLFAFDPRSNRIEGDVYESSTGIFYVHTPSQWANQMSWLIMTPEDILNEYGDMLDDKDADYVIAAGNVEVE
jgi:hypothetical protein